MITENELTESERKESAIALGRLLLRKNISIAENLKLLRIRNTVRLDNPISPAVRLVNEVKQRKEKHENGL